MAKIVYSHGFGGFVLNGAQKSLYCRLKEVPIYPASDENFVIQYYLDQEHTFLFDFTSIKRDDPCLVEVVERLCNFDIGLGTYLMIKEVPSGWFYKIFKTMEGLEEVLVLDSLDMSCFKQVK